ncbi:MAG: hypothetical protein KAW12_02595 [Candidatus Aminicenantes bacterium]|nr:hypothetical protein [Candidatus Aminicenantes bacterium]
MKPVNSEVSILINHVYYYLHYVFIEIDEGNHRLVVIHNSRVKTDKNYKTFGAAKRAFARTYNRKAWKKGVTPHWSPLYTPCRQWLEEKHGILNM